MHHVIQRTAQIDVFSAENHGTDGDPLFHFIEIRYDEAGLKRANAARFVIARKEFDEDNVPNMLTILFSSCLTASGKCGGICSYGACDCIKDRGLVRGLGLHRTSWWA